MSEPTKEPGDSKESDNVNEAPPDYPQPPQYDDHEEGEGGEIDLEIVSVDSVDFHTEEHHHEGDDLDIVSVTSDDVVSVQSKEKEGKEEEKETKAVVPVTSEKQEDEVRKSQIVDERHEVKEALKKEEKKALKKEESVNVGESKNVEKKVEVNPDKVTAKENEEKDASDDEEEGEERDVKEENVGDITIVDNDNDAASETDSIPGEQTYIDDEQELNIEKSLSAVSGDNTDQLEAGTLSLEIPISEKKEEKTEVVDIRSDGEKRAHQQVIRRRLSRQSSLYAIRAEAGLISRDMVADDEGGKLRYIRVGITIF